MFLGWKNQYCENDYTTKCNLQVQCDPYQTAAAAAAAAKLLQSCLTVRPHRRQPTRLLCSWDSPGKNTGAGCHFLLHPIKLPVAFFTGLE